MAAVTLQPTTAPQVFSVSPAVTSTTQSVTVDAGSNRCLVVCVQGEGSGSGTISVSTITYGGVSLTRLDEASNPTWGFSEVWRLIAPAVGTANLVVTLDVADVFVVGTLVGQGVDQTTPLRTAAKTTGTGTSVSVTVGSVAADDLVFDSLSIDGTGHASAPGADQTERWDAASQSGRNEGVTSTQPGTAGGVMSYSWTTSTSYSYVASAFIAVAAAAATSQPLARRAHTGLVMRGERRV